MKRPELKEYQSRAISYAHENPYSILALDPGLGKSRCAIEIQNKLKNKCLVVCPSYLISNWAKEIEKWGENSVYTLIRKSKGKYTYPNNGYVVTSYDLIQKAEHLIEWADMVILDEAHAIKSMKAKRTQFIHKTIFENSVKRVHLLTGTPIKNRVQEFYSLLALCFYRPDIADPDFLDLYPSEIDFADKFSYRKDYQIEVNYRYVTIMKWEGLRNIEELRIHLAGKYIRIKSSDVLDLPPVINKEFQVSDDEDPNLIEAFNNYFSDDDDKKDMEREERTGSVLPEHKAIAAQKKVPFTIKYVENLLEETNCALVYTDHVQSAIEIAKAFNVTPITGSMSPIKRAEMAKDFQEGKGNLLVCTIGSMKEGVDLYRSNHIVFNDYPWVPGDLKQVIYRIQRIGQQSTCFVHKIIGSPQDGYIMDVIEQKMAIIEKAT